MSRESTEALRARLLADPEVQLMIRMRAFEIYQMRGDQPGNPAGDWFRAESEVLAFLIDEENRRAAEEAQPPAPETVAGVELASSAEETADPETSVGAWSATEPAGMELAPEIGGDAPLAAPKKTRTRSATKAPSTRAKKPDDGAAKQTTTRRTASKKAAEPTDKPKRTRKKTTPVTSETNE
ncbi:MAG TPA: DUF2934 domain-containing protein [Blastocatellia bacterium]|nr:DUF2934 domain-containing protein [Blastocatellia bacterium]